MLDPSAPSPLARILQKLPGVSVTARMLWLFHAIAICGMGYLLTHLKLPSATRMAERLAEGKPPSFGDYLAMGLHKGAIAYIAIAAVILLTVRWWGRSGGVAKETRWRLDTPKARWFWPVLLALLVIAGALRWPRMSLSYWGDEGWAVREYVHGEYEPVSGKDMQGELKFVPVTWMRVFFDDHTAGNHMAFSIVQRFTLDAWRAIQHLPPTAFDETVSRLPPFFFGMASLVAIACFFRWLGAARVGLIATALLVFHSWHIRYSTEARGYSMMFFFFILLIWAGMQALQTGRWRWWLAFGVLEFLCMYSWKGSMYPVGAVSACFGAWLLWGRGFHRQLDGKTASKSDRWTSIVRLIMVNLMAGAVFAILTGPSTLQISDAKARIVQLAGKPMDAHWLRDSLSGITLGMPWDHDDPGNPTETVLSDAIAKQPLFAGTALAIEIALILIGCVLMCRRQAWHGRLWLAITLSVVLGALCFMYLIHAEWIYWYSFYVVMPLAVFKAFTLDAVLARGLAAGTSRGLAVGCICFAVAAPTLVAATAWPHTRLMQTQAYESHREVWQLTRGQHEPLGFTGPSKVYTRYLWRYIHLYDPRSDGHVRDGAALRELMAKVDAEHGELYFTVGQRQISKLLCPEVMELLNDDKLFELKATLWAEQEIHTAAVYHYRGNK
jgi:Dolichyl-phosphate-mannose-protein mannosyltransferase